MTRRDFLKWFITGFGVVSLGGIFYPAIKFLKPPPAVAGALGQATNVGALSTFPAGQLTPVSVNGQPAFVANVSGTYTVHSLSAPTLAAWSASPVVRCAAPATAASSRARGP